MNNKSRIIYLVEQCLSGTETVDEREELSTYFLLEECNPLLEEIVEQSFYTKNPLTDLPKKSSKAIIDSIINTFPVNNQIKKKKSPYHQWASVAALFILLASPLVILMPIQELKIEIGKVEPSSAKNEAIQRSVNIEKEPTAIDIALLTTSGGEVYKLDELAIGKSINIGDAQLEKTGMATISFQHNKKYSTSTNTINTLVTPRGSSYAVTLSDGSIVDLNAESKLIFPTFFIESERQVSLEGEGFFDIAIDTARRFVVQVITATQQQDILVYGTKFNINAYSTTDGIITTLVEGAVKVRTSSLLQELKPLQQTLLKDGKLILSAANLDLNLAWRNELFYFIDEPIESVMHEIGRCYDVDIVYNDGIPPVKIWGQISRKKNLSEILKILTKTNDLRFEVKGKEIIVME